MYHAIITTVQDSNKFSRKTKTPSAMFAAKGVCTGHVTCARVSRCMQSSTWANFNKLFNGILMVLYPEEGSIVETSVQTVKIPASIFQFSIYTSFLHRSPKCNIQVTSTKNTGCHPFGQQMKIPRKTKNATKWHIFTLLMTLTRLSPLFSMQTATDLILRLGNLWGVVARALSVQGKTGINFRKFRKLILWWKWNRTLYLCYFEKRELRPIWEISWGTLSKK